MGGKHKGRRSIVVRKDPAVGAGSDISISPKSIADRFRARISADLALCARSKLITTKRDARGNVVSQTENPDRPGQKYLNYVNSIQSPDFASTILIEIPSYCDPELKNTIMAARAMAANPDRVRFSVCLQDDDESIAGYLAALPGCRMKQFAKADAPGTCAARYECQQMYDGEDFVFHVDAHMRFARYWDLVLIDQWRKCDDPNAVLTAWGVDLRKEDLLLPVDSDMFNTMVPTRRSDMFNQVYANGPGIITGSFFADGKWDPRFVYGQYFYDFQPRHGAFVCGHFLFGPGKLDMDVPVDKYMDFTGDEFAVAVRCYTHGYNVYHPGVACIYHLWGKESIYAADLKAPSGDQVFVDSGMTRKQRQIRRVEKLLQLEDHPDVDLSGFGLGATRSLAEFVEYSGLLFDKAWILRFCHDGVFGREHSEEDVIPVDWYPIARAHGCSLDRLTWADKSRSVALGIINLRLVDVRIVEHAHGLTLRLPECLNADTVSMDCMTRDFNYTRMAEFAGGTRHVDVPLEDVGKFLKLRIRFWQNDILLKEFSDIMNPLVKKTYRKIGMKACLSYHGITIGFLDSVIYDRFKLFEFDGCVSRLIVETEDFQATSRLIQVGHVYYVEGYMKNKESGDYELTGISDDWTCVITERDACDDPEISIVMPVYNVKYFLARALDSVILQSFSSIELICVDDASTDGETPVILAWYAEHYPFIHVFRNDFNRNLSATRNVGIGYAVGRYIAVMDSDDLIHYDMHRLLYEAIQSTDSDVAISRVVRRLSVGSRNMILECPDSESVQVRSYEEMMHLKDVRSPDNIYFIAVWNKIVRADLIRKVYYPDDDHGYDVRMKYEDSAYTPALYSFADKFVLVKDAYIVWEQRQRETTGTLSTRDKDGKCLSQLDIWRHYFESIFFSLKFCPERHVDVLKYDQTKDMIEKCSMLNAYDLKTDVQRQSIRLSQEGIREFGLDACRLVMTDKPTADAVKRIMDIVVPNEPKGVL